jgi:hypothetical protein
MLLTVVNQELLGICRGYTWGRGSCRFYTLESSQAMNTSATSVPQGPGTRAVCKVADMVQAWTAVGAALSRSCCPAWPVTRDEYSEIRQDVT